MDIINYTKAFDNFEDGLKELVNLVPDVLTYLNYTEGMTEADASSDLLKKYATNMNVSSNPNYPYTYKFAMDSFGLLFGTDKRMRFGWRPRIFPDRKYFIFKVVFPDAKRKSNCENELLENGWKSKVIQQKQRIYKPNVMTEDVTDQAPTEE